MDREIPKETRLRARRRQWLKWGGGLLAGACLVGLVTQWARASLDEADLVFSTVDEGSIEVSVNATGRVVPAFEEIINSPIQSRILETYKRGGDQVEKGEPILKLDLQSVETDYEKQLDEERMRVLQLEQLKVQTKSRLSEMEMQLKVSRMELSRKVWSCAMNVIWIAWGPVRPTRCSRWNWIITSAG